MTRTPTRRDMQFLQQYLIYMHLDPIWIGACPGVHSIYILVPYNMHMGLSSSVLASASSLFSYPSFDMYEGLQ